MPTETVWPESLPEKPEGWTKHMHMHMNFGREGGAATYAIRAPGDVPTPITYQYDTRKGGRTGFTVTSREDVMTWTQLREAWPAILAEREKSAA